MSKVYPTKSVGSSPGFEVGDPVKFHMFLEKLYKVFLQFGRKGRDLIPHLKAHPPHVIPTADDMMIVTPQQGDPTDLHSNYRPAVMGRVYALALTTPASGNDPTDPAYVLAVYGPDLTDQSYHRLARLLKISDDAVAEDRRDLVALVLYLLVECSQGSRDTLKTHQTWEPSVYGYDHLEMMRLIRLTHKHGSMCARMRYLREFVTTSQGRLTLDAYIGLVRSRLGLVVAAYEDPQHAGYIRTDLLFGRSS